VLGVGTGDVNDEPAPPLMLPFNVGEIMLPLPPQPDALPTEPTLPVGDSMLPPPVLSLGEMP